MNKISAVAFFCEDIRQEGEGRFTLIGLLSDNILVPEFATMAPGNVGMRPKFCIFVRANFDPSEKLNAVSTKLINPDGSEIDLGQMDQKIIEEARNGALKKGLPLAGITISLQASPFIIAAPGQMRIEMNIDGEKLICGALNFLAPDDPRAGS